MLMPKLEAVLAAATVMTSVAAPSPVTVAAASPANVPEGDQLVAVCHALPVAPVQERTVCACIDEAMTSGVSNVNVLSFMSGEVWIDSVTEQRVSEHKIPQIKE